MRDRSINLCIYSVTKITTQKKFGYDASEGGLAKTPLVGELKEKPERPFPTFLQPLSNALRVFKRDKPRERWRPVGRPPLALSSQLEANGLAFGGAVFDTPLATVVEQRPLQRPTPPRKQVQRRRWCCPELGWSTASAIFSSW
jgi:hypothetical protein